MKHLFLAPELYRGNGGIQVYSREFCRALSRTADVCVLSLNDEVVKTDEPFRFCGSGRARFFRKYIFVVRAFLMAFFYKPDYIWCGHVHISCLCRLMQRLTGIPFISILHGIESWEMSGCQRKAVASSRRIISVSVFTREKVLRQIPAYPLERIDIIPGPVNPAIFKPRARPAYLAKSLGIESHHAVILTVSRLSAAERYKGYDRVIQALSAVRESIPDVRYIIVGSGDDQARLCGLIHEKGLDKNVILAGFVPSEMIPFYYNLCDCFAMPSSGEGLGIVFLEALASGKPVVAGNRDASSEALLKGELGVLVNPDDSAQIAEAIIGLLKHTLDARFSDAQFLHDEVVKNFGIERFRERTVLCVKNLT